MSKLGKIATSRKWKYAIGEIILIVIGILIAVQLNNWNEQLKEKTTEKLLLKGLKSDLEKNYKMYEKRNSGNKKTTDNIINYISDIEKIKDTTQIEKYIMPPAPLYSEFDPVRSTFKQMENTGQIYNLSKDSIKDAIIEYYSLMGESQRLLRVQQNFVQDQYNHKDLAMMRENHFNLFNGRKINDKNLQWLNDVESDQFIAYKSMVYMIQGIIAFENYQMDLLKKECTKVLEMLEKY